MNRQLGPLMDERVRRNWAAAETQAYSWGGVSAVSSATGMSRKTIRKGVAELGVRESEPDAPVTPRLRSPGGGPSRSSVGYFYIWLVGELTMDLLRSRKAR